MNTQLKYSIIAIVCSTVIGAAIFWPWGGLNPGVPGVPEGLEIQDREYEVWLSVAFLGEGEYFVDVYFASHDMKVIKYNERGLVAERSLLELPDGPTGIAVTGDGNMNRIDRPITSGPTLRA